MCRGSGAIAATLRSAPPRSSREAAPCASQFVAIAERGSSAERPGTRYGVLKSQEFSTRRLPGHAASSRAWPRCVISCLATLRRLMPGHAASSRTGPRCFVSYRATLLRLMPGHAASSRTWPRRVVSCSATPRCPSRGWPRPRRLHLGHAASFRGRSRRVVRARSGENRASAGARARWARRGSAELDGAVLHRTLR